MARVRPRGLRDTLFYNYHWHPFRDTAFKACWNSYLSYRKNHSHKRSRYGCACCKCGSNRSCLKEQHITRRSSRRQSAMRPASAELGVRLTMKHSGNTISVTVEYKLAEYKRMVFDVMPLHLAALQKPPNRYLPWNLPIINKAFAAVFIPIIFKIKVAKVGICKFTFGEDGFS